MMTKKIDGLREVISYSEVCSGQVRIETSLEDKCGSKAKAKHVSMYWLLDEVAAAQSTAAVFTRIVIVW